MGYACVAKRGVGVGVFGLSIDGCVANVSQTAMQNIFTLQNYEPVYGNGNGYGANK